MNFVFNVSDLVARLNVASKKKLVSVKVNYTHFTLQILRVLWKNGIICGFSVFDRKHILVYLKYHKNKPIFKELVIVSRPGHRVYWTLNFLSLNTKFSSFCGFFIVSTSDGLLVSSDCMLNSKISGEVILKVTI